MNIRQIDFYLKTVARPWLVLAAIALASRILKAPTFATGWLSWLVLVFLVASCYGLLTWLLVLNVQEKGVILAKARVVAVRLRLFVTAERGLV